MNVMNLIMHPLSRLGTDLRVDIQGLEPDGIIFCFTHIYPSRVHSLVLKYGNSLSPVWELKLCTSYYDLIISMVVFWGQRSVQRRWLIPVVHQINEPTHWSCSLACRDGLNWVREVKSCMHINKLQQEASTIVVQDRGILLLDLGFLLKVTFLLILTL